MTTMHITDDDLVLHYYGEMTAAAEARTCAHLDDCTECRERLLRLQRVMAALDSVPVPEPDAFFEQRTWSRVESSMSRAPRGRTWAVPWRPLAWGAAAALVIIAAFVAGQFTSQPATPIQTAATADPVGDRVLLVDLGDHLDRTETALIEFVSGTDAGNIASGRARMEDLVAANRLYRRTAVIAGDQGVADVLDELERVLIEIAGASPEASADDLDVMRRRIDTRGLLFKVRVMREQLQERAREPVTVRRQETTL